MAREVTAVTTITAAARLESPLHVGTADVAPGADAAVFRDGQGRLLLPGTSITGALRAALGESVTRPDRWGAADEEGMGASRVVVHDAPLTTTRDGTGEPAVGRRDGVAIDRAWGSAVDGLLYAREVVPAGAWVALRIEVHSTRDSAKDDLALVAAIRQVLLDELRLGARTSRGLGRLRTRRKHLSVRRVDYGSPQAYWRTRRAPEPVGLPAVAPDAADVLDVEVDWLPNGPVMVTAGARATSTPRLPVVEPDPTTDPDQAARLRLVIPGTAVAGALRGRAELVCRTLRGTTTPDTLPAQLTSTPLVRALFGSAAGEDDATASPLTVQDCPSTTTMAAEFYTLVTADPTPRSVPASGGAELRVTDHVSVDRWTGGASDGRLFQEVEPHGFAFHPLRLRLHRARLPAEVRNAATALLLVTLRELVDGRVPLGGATHRGYGSVEVTEVRLQGTDLKGTGLDLTADRFAGIRRAWRTWIESGENR